MANNLTSNPWYFDTAGAAVLFAGDIYLDHLEYAGYAAQGNIAEVTDRFGKLVAHLTGAADLQEVRTGKIDKIHGIAVTTLQGGGILRVYIR